MRIRTLQAGLLFTAVTAACGPNFYDYDYNDDYESDGGMSRYDAGSYDAKATRKLEFPDVARPDTPPLSGGTLAADAKWIVASDPDRDQIYIVKDEQVRTIKLNPRDEPGRVAILDDRAVVALRGTGEYVELDLGTAMLVRRVKACAVARGVELDRASGDVFVACREGNLAQFDTSGVLRSRTEIDFDLRDVVRVEDGLLVSTFRDPQIYKVGLSVSPLGNVPIVGTVLKYPAGSTDGLHAGFRMRATSAGVPIVIGQSATDPTSSNPNAYYTNVSGDGAVLSTQIRSAGFRNMSQSLWARTSLPLDVALREDTARPQVLVIAAGNTHQSRGNRQTYATSDQTTSFFSLEGVREYRDGAPAVPYWSMKKMGQAPIQPIAAAVHGGHWIVQSREPAELLVLDDNLVRIKTIPLAQDSVEDTGHAIFHTNAGGGVACAGCHLEGGDDGRVWKFFGRPRKTMSLLGTVNDTAPYHWDESDKSLGEVLDSVYTTRMSGPPLDAGEKTHMTRWLGALKAPNSLPNDASRALRGKSIFEGSGQCASCHAGPTLSSAGKRDLGMGESLGVPSLVGVAWHPPFMHNGCARTLEERFTGCGAIDAHGKTSQLSVEERGDLIEYLKSL
ncbi:MAG: c-type cytochrome [Polyangiaceae bacterium]|nr:c-type cytochrome [Polyangiaceae bacterium]